MALLTKEKVAVDIHLMLFPAYFALKKKIKSSIERNQKSEEAFTNLVVTYLEADTERNQTTA